MSTRNRRDFLTAGAVTAGATLLVNQATRRAQAQHNDNDSTCGYKRVRKEINSLSDAELMQLRAAVGALQKKVVGGINQYQRIAGFHGVPGGFCHNDPTIFLPWHRAYILEYENLLVDIDASVTLPYWDWTTAEAQMNGIPPALADETYTDATGATVPNPLFSANIGPLGQMTQRFPDPPSLLGSLATSVNNAYTGMSYSSFNSAIDGPHGGLHVWVGGSMGGVAFAAYDPIFYIHHANVDFQWARWQAGPNNADPPPSIGALPMAPFNRIVSTVVNYEQDLCYVYDGLTPAPPQRVFELASAARTLKSGGGLKVRRPAKQRARRVLLNVQGLRSSQDSFKIRAFINKVDANARTSTQMDNFAGMWGIFGHGAHGGQAARHGGHSMMKTNLVALDMTEAVDKVAGDQPFDVSLVVTKLDDTGAGTQVDLDQLPIDGISVEVD